MEWILAIVYAIGVLSTVVELYNSDESVIMVARSRMPAVGFGALALITALLWPVHRLVRMVLTLVSSRKNDDEEFEDEDLPPQ